MADALRFIFGFHCHQPAGNPVVYFEEAVKKSYLPLLTTIQHFPKARLTLHVSGSLLEYLLKKHKPLIGTLGELVERGQIELLSSGIYDPILPLIPEEDRFGQIEMMNDRLEKLFGQRPTGFWLPERVYDASLISSLEECGIRYLFLDDHHFYSTGWNETDLYNSFITEEGGASLRIFPISSRLRYAMPFQPPQETVDNLTMLARENSGGIATLMDDGEKLGLWSGTEFDYIENSWLWRFLEKTEAVEFGNSIKMLTAQEVLDETTPKAKVYLPAGSYLEMQEWSLSTQKRLRLHQLQEEFHQHGAPGPLLAYQKPGNFQNFLLKYPEVDHLHKRMLRTSVLLNGQRRSRRRDEALQQLYKSQVGDTYWHGVYAGIYHPALRGEAWRSLLTAEQALTGENLSPLHAMEEDLDFDGFNEILLENNQIALWLDPRRGGTMLSLDDRKNTLNIIATMTGWPEPCHLQAGIPIPGRVEQRRSLRDRFLQSPFNPNLPLEEQVEVADFAEGDFRYGVKSTKRKLDATLERDGFLCHQSAYLPHTLQKRIVLDETAEKLQIQHLLRNNSSEYQEYNHCIEWNFSTPTPKSLEIIHPEKINLQNECTIEDIKKLILVDTSQKNRLIFSFDDLCRVVFSPVYTVSAGMCGAETILQGVRLLICNNYSLKPAGVKKLRYTVQLATETSTKKNRRKIDD